jgi:uncharacterized membrane protein
MDFFGYFGVAAAQAMLGVIITAMLTFVVFTFGSLLVAIQVASGQLTLRIIATTLLRNGVVRYATGLLVFTLLFAIRAIDRMQTRVFQLVVFVAGFLGVLCLAAFLCFIDYTARLLRSISIVAHVRKEGLELIEHVYPHPSIDLHRPESRRENLAHRA